MIAKAMGGVYSDNVAERFGGYHVYSEQEWLEGPLGTRDVHLENNLIKDRYVTAGNRTHIDVMKGLFNITCQNTTFLRTGQPSVSRASGC